MDAITSPISNGKGSLGPAVAPAVEAPIAEPVSVPAEPAIEGKGSADGAAHGTLAKKSSRRSPPTLSQKLQQQWVPCSVCGLDVTWPYVLHSDASRAVVAHNCRKCGEVVCSLCSPAGDSLPGDGKPTCSVNVGGLHRNSCQHICDDLVCVLILQQV